MSESGSNWLVNPGVADGGVLSDVTPDMVHNTAVACQQGAETISGLLGALKNYILGLEGLWGGIAANTFQDMMAQYQADSIQITTALAEIGDKLMANYNNIITTEEANVRTVSSVQNSLPSTNFS